MTHTTSTKGALALLSAALLYACFGLFIREMAHMFGNNAQVAFRFVFAFIFLAAIAVFIKRPVRLAGRTLAKAAFLGLAFCGVVLLFTVAVNLTTLGNAVFLVYGGSIITSLVVGTLVLKEKLTATKLLAIGLALAGLAMYSSALLSLSLGVVAAVGSGLLDGLSNSIRKTLAGVDRNSILLYQYAFGTVMALAVLAIWPQDAIRTISLGPIIAGLIFAGSLIGLGNLLLYGFQHFDVNVGTVILATELFFATLVGLIFFGEIPAPHELIGGFIIFAASILSAVDLKALLRIRRTAS